MGIIRYLGSLIKTDTGNSSKSFALVMSTLLSFVVGLIMASVLAYDGFKDGVIDTDLERAGIFMICVGSCVAASGVPKIFGDRDYSRYRRYGNGMDYDNDRYRSGHSMSRDMKDDEGDEEMVEA